jgi:CheY-like chemotaxis protein
MREKILIVDDEPEIRRLMAKVLTGEGYHVNCSLNPPSGKEQRSRYPSRLFWS